MTVEDYPSIVAGPDYAPVFIFDIEKKGRPPRLEGHFQEPRTRTRGTHPHADAVPAGTAGGGRCAEFFRALGQDVSVGASLALDDAKGKTLSATFGATSSKDVEIVAFQPISKESGHAAGSE